MRALGIMAVLHAASYALCVAGLWWLGSLFGWEDLRHLALSLGVYFTALHLLASFRRERWLRRVAVAVLVPAHVVWLALGVAFGVLLAWAVPLWDVLLVALATAGVVATARRPRDAVRVPPALPIGLWLLGCFLAWGLGDATVRCDDLARLRAQPHVDVLVPTSDAASRCVPGAAFPIARYPRKIVDAPDGRLLFTTGASRVAGAAPGARLAGSVCETPPDAHASPHCVGLGTAHGLVVAAPIDTVFAPAGERIYVLPARGPLAVRATWDVPLATSAGYYDPDGDVLGIFSDWSFVVVRVNARTRAPLLTGVLITFPNDVRYDPLRHEGLVCSASGGPLPALASVIRPEPFTFEALGQDPVAALSMFAGCDWDEAHETVYVTSPALGLLATVDRRSRRIRRTRYVGLGADAVAADGRRHRVYVGDFFAGVVRALDATSGREVARWFVGRYVRDLHLTRDGGALLATSTAGIVRIRL